MSSVVTHSFQPNHLRKEFFMDNQKFGAFIAEQRKAKGRTQVQLAEKLNVTDKAVSKWERGAGFPDIKLLEPLAAALDLSIMELMKSERLQKENFSKANTTDAFHNIINVAAYERKIKQQRIFLITVLIILFITAIFLIDIMQPLGILFVCLPVIFVSIGIWFLWLSHKKDTHKRLFLLLGMLAFVYPLCLMLLFCFAFMLGGPVPN